MERTLDQLIHTLKEMVGLHRQLMQLVRDEKENLLAADIRTIQDTTHSKQVLLASIRAKENDRLKNVAQLAVYLKRRPDELSLEEIAIAVQASHAERAHQLRQQRNTLEVFIKRIQEQNHENQGLVEKSLDHVRNMKENAIGATLAKSATYSDKGTKVAKLNDARLLNQEAY